MTISRKLLCLIRSKPVTHADLEHAALFTLDAIANAIAGQNSAPGNILVGWGRDHNALYNHRGNNRSMDPGRRALLLGGLTHILELDDLHRESVVHPGCVVVPAVWALAESSDTKPGGVAILTAILHGFEAAIRVGAAVGLEHYRTFHNTATCGPFGSAMASATLLDLTEEMTIHALGNAGTQAAGLWQFLETGAMSKHLHAGRAAEAGLVAADFASRGFTGPESIFEGDRGFFAGLAPKGDPGMILHNPDTPWQLTQTSIKPWPSCRHTHPGIDAAQQVRAEMLNNDIGIDRIKSVHINAYQAALDVCDRPDPETPYDAKFSLQHCIAVGLGEDIVNFSSFEAPARAAHSDLRVKVTLSTSNHLNKTYPAHWGSDIAVTLENGAIFSAKKADAKGDPEAPLSPDDLIEKARILMTFGNYKNADNLIDGILDMANNRPVPKLLI